MLKRRNYTFALTIDDTPNLNEIISIVERYPKYAYILHDKDTNDDGTVKKNHYHFYVEFPNPRYLNSVANELSVKSNYIEQVYNKKGILEYLTHENQPDKYHYSKSQIKSNFDIDDDINDGGNIVDMYKDYRLVKVGLMDPLDFLQKYKIYCATLSICCKNDYAYVPA